MTFAHFDVLYKDANFAAREDKILILGLQLSIEIFGLSPRKEDCLNAGEFFVVEGEGTLRFSVCQGSRLGVNFHAHFVGFFGAKSALSQLLADIGPRALGKSEAGGD